MEKPITELFCTILSEIESCARNARARVQDPGAREALAHFGAELGLSVMNVRKELLDKPAAKPTSAPLPPAKPHVGNQKAQPPAPKGKA